MDVFEAIYGRRSIRSYENRSVPIELIEKVIDAARFAPSGANLQPWKFVVIIDEELRKAIGNTARFYFVKSRHVEEAPVLIAACADLKKSKWAVIDTALACQNLMLAAHAVGLGTCFVGIFDEALTKELLRIPEHYRVIGLITMGYPAVEESAPRRLEIREILGINAFPGETPVKRAMTYTRSGPVSVIGKILKLIFKR
jgi:nitroreductase